MTEFTTMGWYGDRMGPRGWLGKGATASRRHPLVAGASALAAIALVSSAAVATATLDHPGPSAVASAGVPKLPGTVVKISLTDSGGPMGEGTGPMHPGAMGLDTDHASVPHGSVSFLVANAGKVNHEMAILPLAHSQVVGTRSFDGEAKVDEAGVLGEASNSGGEGAGEGIAPGASGWVTVTLTPGRYELVCNLAGHYVSGMSAELTVT
jgi:uncharacterized cupredoxin-like copper-binding protein